MLFRTGSIQEPIIYGKTTRDLHMLHANQLQRPQLYFSVFFASNLPHAVTLKHFFTCGACSPQIWWILLTSPDLSCIVGTLLHVWIPAISPPFLAIFLATSTHILATSPGAYFAGISPFVFRISPFVFLISPVVVIVVGFCLFSYRHTVLIKVLKNKLAFGDQGI